MELTEPESSARAYPTRPLVGVGAVLVQDGRVLLVKRKHEPGAGSWTLPGGLVELGETASEAVCREVFEECGLVVRVDRLLDVVDFVEKDDKAEVKYHYVLLDYTVSLVSGEPEADTDASDTGWYALSDLDSFDIPQITVDFFHRHGDLLNSAQTT